MADVTITHAPEQHRYLATIEGEQAGLADYRLHDGVITYTHTEVGDEFGGQGVGSALARHMLDDARAQGLRVVPACSFIAGWIDKHPDYAELVERG